MGRALILAMHTSPKLLVRFNGVWYRVSGTRASGACLGVKWRLPPPCKKAQVASFYFGNEHKNVFSGTIGPIRTKFDIEQNVDEFY